MPSGQYSYIDITALDAVRTRFAAGDALALLTPALDELIWANGEGAALFGYPDIGSSIGREPQIGLAAKRQITAAPGYPHIGQNRAITIRLASGMTSRAVSLVASEIVLPEGEAAILLAAPNTPAGWLSPAEAAGRAIDGLGQAGQHAAIIDAGGKVAAASYGFASLDIGADAIRALVSEAASERLIKRMIEAGTAFLPAGFVRLTDDPATHLLVVVDEAPEHGETSDEPEPVQAGLSHENLPAPLTPPERDSAVAEMSEEPQPVQAGLSDEDLPPPLTPPHKGEGDSATAEMTDEPEPIQAGPSLGDLPPPLTPPLKGDSAAAPSAPGSDEAGEAVESVVPVEEGSTQVDETADTSDEAAATEEIHAGEERSGIGDGQPEAAKDPHEIALHPHAGTVVDRSAAPVRFVWKTDAEGHFSEISDDFVKAVGKPAAAVVGVAFREAAERLGIDPGGEIAGLLERRDTWSGRSVLWPVAGTDLRIPVDLAALPAYGRDRQFTGFRGFGVARAGDAVVDPDARGLELVEAGIAPDTVEKVPEPGGGKEPARGEETPERETPASQSEQDPFRGEVPALSIVPKQDRRQSDKVIRLAEHRPANGGDKGLSAGERNAFREIGDRLRRENETAGAENPGEQALHADNDHGSAPQAPESGETAPPVSEDVRAEEKTAQPVAAREAGETGQREGVEPQSAGTEATISDIAGILARRTAELEAEETGRDEAEPAEGAGEAAEEVANVDPLSVSGSALDTSPPVDGGEDTPAAMPGAHPLPSQSGGEVARAEPETERGHDVPTAADRSQDFVPSAFAVGPAAAARPPVDTTILEQLPVPVLIHSGDALHFANREFLDFTGYDSIAELDEAGGLGALFGEPYADDEADGEGSRTPRLRTSEGLEYPVEAFLQSVPWGQGKALLLSLRRSWRQPVSYPASPPPSPLAAPTDPELEERIAEMRAIVDTATDGVVLIAPDGTIRSISSPAEALFGFDSAEIAGKPFISLFAIESQRAARDYLAGLSENGVASVLNDGREVIGREGQGRFIPLFMTMGRLPNDSGYCAVVRDITQWKRAEEELTQARAQAERASSQKTDFLARVSHEIRTPLNAIIGFSELMLDEKFGPILNDRYKDYLRDINRSGNHVLDLVNDLLDISKIEAGQQEMSYEAVSLNDTLAETVAMMQPQANRERVIIRSSFASRLPEVVADLRSVRQIALNLMSNAIRYTPAGGQVIVSTAYEPSGDVVMRVRDTGIGMSQAEIEQALKPFKQINALKRTRGDGTGLGLPLTKAMVEANRARFMINSTPGEGTLVEITFPSTRVLAE